MTIQINSINGRGPGDHMLFTDPRVAIIWGVVWNIYIAYSVTMSGTVVWESLKEQRIKMATRYLHYLRQSWIILLSIFLFIYLCRYVPVSVSMQHRNDTVLKPSLLQENSTYSKVELPISKIIHNMHASIDKLEPIHTLLRNKCRELHPEPEWKIEFWDDIRIEKLIKNEFSEYYKDWKNLTPFIRRVDTSRYMLMYLYGGIYMDVDVECVRSMNDLIRNLPNGTAWTGDYPEPMFLMSSPGNPFWLHMVKFAIDNSKTKDVWESTGPGGLQASLVEWVIKYGVDSISSFYTDEVEREHFDTYNNSIRWYKYPELKADEMNNKLQFEPVKKFGKIGFVPNPLLDPVSCNAEKLRRCVKDFCAPYYPNNFVVHHCLSSWRTRMDKL